MELHNQRICSSVGFGFCCRQGGGAKRISRWRWSAKFSNLVNLLISIQAASVEAVSGNGNKSLNAATW